MKIITIFDTTVAGSNLGDHIIMDSIENILKDIFHNDFFIHVQTHDIISNSSYNFINQSSLKFVGGTNLLSSNMNSYNQWKVNLYDSSFIKDIILMGVGWWQYQDNPNDYTKILLSRLLSSKYIHSVRDSYTETKLKLCGFNNVINTTCPTMWSLNKQHCSEIPATKSNEVVMTFTEYNQNINYDNQLFKILLRNYEKIYFWTQQPNDYLYMQSIGCGSVEYIPPNLKSLDSILSLKQVDYIGTRLHAGVRALQKKRRSLILSVDNRAAEISKDTNLPVINRTDVDGIEKWINNPTATIIRLPEENIERWKMQFIGC